MKEIMLTGARPTGDLHLGHYVGAFKNFVDIQKKYECYFVISDIHMLTTKCSPEFISEILDNTRNMVIDSIGMGLDPNKTTFYLQSNIPELAYIFILIQNLIDAERLRQIPSLEEMTQHIGKLNHYSLGLLGYPVLEAADIISIQADCVPVGKDNIDHIKVTQEIASKINSTFKANLKIPNYITSKNNHIVGLDGNHKMSKSLKNAIFVKDSPKEVSEKINKIIWTKSSDSSPNVVIEYLKVFGSENDTVKELLEDFSKDRDIEKASREMLINILNDILSPMHERSYKFKENPHSVDEILAEETKKVRKVVINNLNYLKEKMKLPNLYI